MSHAVCKVHYNGAVQISSSFGCCRPVLVVSVADTQVSVLQPADLAAALAGCSQLTQLCLAGPDGSEMKFDLKGPLATIRHATDSTLALLTGLADRLERLDIEGEKRRNQGGAHGPVPPPIRIVGPSEAAPWGPL